GLRGRAAAQQPLTGRALGPPAPAGGPGVLPVGSTEGEGGEPCRPRTKTLARRRTRSARSTASDMQGGPEPGRHPEGREMEDEFVVIVRRFNANGAPYLLNVKAYPSPEEAAGAAGAHMRTDGLPKGQVIDRIVTMLDLNIGAVHLVRGLNSTYRILHAHRLGDGTLVAPGLLV